MMCSNHVPWAILSACWFTCGVLFLVTRVYLAHENARREKEGADTTYDDVYITQEKEDGTKVEVKVEKVCCSSTFEHVISAN